MGNPKTNYEIAEEIVTALLTTVAGTGTRLAVKDEKSTNFSHHREIDLGGRGKQSAINEVTKILNQHWQPLPSALAPQAEEKG